jgi:chemotaxis signal transduction protein
MSTLHVRVRVAGEDYALPVEDVLEVAEYGEVAPVPGAPASILGVRNLRGQVLPVLDLARILGLPPGPVPERLVVAQEAGRKAGLAVAAVVGVEEMPQGHEPAESQYLTGQTLIDGALVGIVDPAPVLGAVEGAP